MHDRYLLLGGNVLSSPTPKMMNAAFEALGLNATYTASSVGAMQLASCFAKLKAGGVKGLNVTIPHKSAMTRLLTSMDEVSTRIAAVNTVHREGKSYRGYNTDVDGIVEPLKSRGISKIGRAFVVGTGGAARAFCEAMNRLHCGQMVALSRDPARAAGFAASMSGAFPEIKIEVRRVDEPTGPNPELLFNASPAGANGIPIPRQLTTLLKGKPIVFDAVYSPVKTELIAMAEELKCPTVCGYEMLLFQAASAIQVWTNRDPPVERMKKVLLESLGGLAP